MNAALERRLLQVAVAMAGIVPVSAGGWGAIWGLGRLGMPGSHARYLSGLLLGIGLIFWWCIPAIERRGTIVRTLGLVVFVGGFARLIGVIHTGLTPAIALPLVMELAVTPLLVLWRERVEKRLGDSLPDAR